MNQTIEVVISPDGKITLHVQGVQGPVCEEITAPMLQILDGMVEQTPTDEYFDGGDQSLLNMDRVNS